MRGLKSVSLIILFSVFPFGQACKAQPAEPRAKTSLYLDATAKLLTKTVGGRWYKPKHERVPGLGPYLDSGELPRTKGDMLRRACFLFPFPLDKSGKAKVLVFASTLSIQLELLGTNDQCTVLSAVFFHGDQDIKRETPEVYKQIIKTLNLSKPPLTLLQLHNLSALKADLDNFHLDFQYHSKQGEAIVCGLTLSVPALLKNQVPMSSKTVRISKDQADRIVDCLWKEGLLFSPTSLYLPGKEPWWFSGYSYRTDYVFAVRGLLGVECYQNLAAYPNMYEKVNALRNALNGDARKAMDELLAQATRHRHKLEKSGLVPPAEVNARQGAEAFLTLANTGNQDKVVRWFDPGASQSKLTQKAKKLAHIGELKVVSAHAERETALVVTTEIKGAKNTGRVVVLELTKMSGLWVVWDINLCTPAKADKWLADFFRKHPAAKVIPSKINMQPTESEARTHSN